MERSWLVQGLSKPWGKGDNPFSFGGGLRNGGLSPEAMDLLRPIFEFDYMGAAEFEFGAVPEAFQSLAQNAESLVADTLTFPLAEVKKPWTDKSKKAPEGDVTVYIIAQVAHVDEVKRRVRAWAKDPYTPENSTKGGVSLDTALRPGKYETRTAGWLELDNGFMFFTDKDMWLHVAALFEVDTEGK